LVGAGIGFLIAALVDRYQSACDDGVEGTLVACTDGPSPARGLLVIGMLLIVGGLVALAVLSSRENDKPAQPRVGETGHQ
jgi:hypothetical protein